MSFMDLTGRFPKHSRSGNQYLLVVYHYDGNVIWAEPLKNRTSQTISQAWKKVQEIFACAGEQPKTWVMDNEASKDLLQAIEAVNSNY